MYVYVVFSDAVVNMSFRNHLIYEYSLGINTHCSLLEVVTLRLKGLIFYTIPNPFFHRRKGIVPKETKMRQVPDFKL